jgi:hypothetical protein
LQFWNSSQQFELNQDDSAACGTEVLLSDLSLSDYSGQLDSGETTMVSPLVSAPGYYVLALSAPGYQGSTANAGRVSVTWGLDSWLRSDFDLDTVTDEPVGVATFVGQPANQPMLFKRESYR